MGNWVDEFKLKLLNPAVVVQADDHALDAVRYSMGPFKRTEPPTPLPWWTAKLSDAHKAVVRRMLYSIGMSHGIVIGMVVMIFVLWLGGELR